MVQHKPNLLRRPIEMLGRSVYAQLAGLRAGVEFVGGLTDLLTVTMNWFAKALFLPKVKLGRRALFGQLVRVGTRAVGIVALVQIFIGIILVLQMAPTLAAYGQVENVANIVGIAMVRELGPLITAIVLSGFAGASIAAELATMVESEEIKALRAHALNPFHFLVLPRFLATVIAMLALAIIADIVGLGGGFLTAWLALDISPQSYIEHTQAALRVRDYLTGLLKAVVFGVLIALIACRQGLDVSGGAEGVGRATTGTVVKCIVALIGVDAVFTAIFYAWGI
jgi:phospholipid/cholesterol/gamma-HCH transport system permease protein